MHNISIYYGIKTGCNDAFIISTEKRDMLVQEDPSSNEILHPILRGRDIARYQANWSDLWLIDSHNGYSNSPPVNIDKYPAVKAHLDTFFDKLKDRQDQGITPYNLRNCAYHEGFSNEKLFWADLTNLGKFSYVPADIKIFCSNSAYFMYGHMMKYLAAFLNSSLISWYVKKNAVTSGVGTPRWISVTVNSIPIPKNYGKVDEINQMVDKLLLSIQEGSRREAREIEFALESQVYQSFEINARERKLICKV